MVDQELLPDVLLRMGCLLQLKQITTPTLKHLNKFVGSSSLEYDIDGFVEEMRERKT